MQNCITNEAGQPSPSSNLLYAVRQVSGGMNDSALSPPAQLRQILDISLSPVAAMPSVVIDADYDEPMTLSQMAAAWRGLSARIPQTEIVDAELPEDG